MNPIHAYLETPALLARRQTGRRSGCHPNAFEQLEGRTDAG